MTTRKYSSRSQQTTLTSAITAGATTMVVGSGTSLLGGATVTGTERFTVVIDPDTALEEIVDVSAVSTNTLTIARGIEVGGTGQSHSAGAVVRHMAIGRDYREANLHVEATAAYNDGTATHDLHGIASGEGDVVGTGKSQTLTNKTLTSPKINENVALTATSTELNILDGVTASAAELNILDGVTASAAELNILDGVTASAAELNILDGATLSVTELNYVDGVTSAIQTQIDTKQAIVSGVSDTEIGYLDGVTSAIQTQIDTKAPIASPTFTGTVTLPTSTVTSTMITDGTIVNADINASAGITYGKLSLNGTITSADIVDGTIVNADINASAAIALSKLATDPLARANHTGTQTASTVSDFDTQVRTSRLDQMAAPTAAVALNAQKITGLADPTSNQDAVTLKYLTDQKGANNGIASLDGSGLIPTSQLPALAITETSVVVSQAAMLALTAQVGDVAVRTDVNKSFILTASPATTLGNWQELLTPTDAVLSVDGNTGAINLSGTYLNSTTGTLLGNLAAGGFKVTGLGTPTSDADAATKVYVDAVAGSATAAASSAAAAATTYDNFDDRYLGAKSTAPSVDNDGDALIEGALYWNSVSDTMFAWSGSAWNPISSTAAIFRYKFTAAGGETSESGLDDNGVTLSYIAGKEQVYLNGVLLVRGTDYTASNGSSITSLAALTAGDILEIITFTAFDLATAIDKALFDAKGDILVATAADTPGKLTVGANGFILKANSATATGLEWVADSAYSAPTLGSTAINSGATVTTIAGLTLTSPTISTITNTGTVTLPTATDTLVGRATTDTLTNKTLTTPKITLTYSAKTDNYTFASGDEGNVFSMNAATAKEFRIPTDATFNFGIGTQFNVFWITGAGQPKIVAATPGTTTVISTGAVSASPNLRVANSMATCLKIAADSWIVIGDIA
jgi:hypothetical protein